MRLRVARKVEKDDNRAWFTERRPGRHRASTRARAILRWGPWCIWTALAEAGALDPRSALLALRK